MPYYSEELIEEVRAGNDIVDVISATVKLQKRGSTYFGLCPFHHEKTPSFSVTPGKQMYYCFGCGAGGNVLTYVMKYENYTFQEAMTYLAERAGISLPKEELDEKGKEEADKRTLVFEIQKSAAKYFYAQLRMEPGEHAMSYLQQRGITPEIMKKFGLGYARKYSNDLYQYLRQQGYQDEILKESGLVTIDEKSGGRDKFWNRVIFPIMNVNHKVIGFGGRVLGEGEPKYLNSPETIIFDKSHSLYGLNFAKSSSSSRLLLCEGYMDVIALHQAGFDNAVASLGTSFTMGHAGLLKRYNREIYLVFDSDKAGVKASLRALPILKEAGLTARIVNLSPYKDPDELLKAEGPEEFQKRLETAENSFLFEIRVLQQNYHLEDPGEKTLFHHEIAKKLLEFQEEIQRKNYMEAIAGKYGLSVEDLQKLVNHMAIQTNMEKVPKPLKSGIHPKKKEDGMEKSQKLMLTWLIEDQRLFSVVLPYIGPEDFTGELLKEAATLLFAQYQQGEVVPAKIINAFQEEEKQQEIASLFHTNIDSIVTRQEKEKALKETIIRIKQNSIEHRTKKLAPDDLEGWKKLVADKQQLQEMQKLHISLD